MTDLTFVTDQGRFNYRVAAVILQGESVLVMSEPGLPYYYLPGGRVGLHEPSEVALRRELKEELQAEIAFAQLLWINEQFFVEDVSQEKFHELCLYYRVELHSESSLFAQSEFEICENGKWHSFKWVAPDELEKSNVYPKFLAKELKQVFAANHLSPKHLVEDGLNDSFPER
ncbi:MAG: NUDIX domain-containing protein [Candidatus Sericytochromatia bacterium]|nr:NUDIX domain-containing protein [Candidatus Sericytochromatia bacterium]